MTVSVTKLVDTPCSEEKDTALEVTIELTDDAELEGATSLDAELDGAADELDGGGASDELDGGASEEEEDEGGGAEDDDSGGGADDDDSGAEVGSWDEEGGGAEEDSGGVDDVGATDEVGSTELVGTAALDSATEADDEEGRVDERDVGDIEEDIFGKLTFYVSVSVRGSGDKGQESKFEATRRWKGREIAIQYVLGIRSW